MFEKESRQNCFLDLKRAATAFCLEPEGKTWRIFLNHSLKILQGEKKLTRFTRRLKEIQR